MTKGGIKGGVKGCARCKWLTTVILATQEAEIRRIEARWGWPQKKKKITKKG
jgi:hypothetical protein